MYPQDNDAVGMNQEIIEQRLMEYAKRCMLFSRDLISLGYEVAGTWPNNLSALVVTQEYIMAKPVLRNPAATTRTN